MKRLLIFSAMLLMALALPCVADTDEGFYIGLKTGFLEPDVSNIDLDDDNPIALQLGWDFGYFALQGEFYTAENDIDQIADSADLDVWGLYGVYRSEGFIYLMLKGGAAQAQIDFFGLDEDETVFSYGGGVGLSFFDFLFVELDYTVYDVDEYDLDFIGLSGNILF